MQNNSVDHKKLNKKVEVKEQNNKLQGENLSRPRILRLKIWSKENKRFIVTLIACIALVIMMLVQTLYMTSQIGILTNQLNYLLDTNSVMEEELSSLQKNIADTLEESNSMLSNCKISILDMNLAEGTYTAGIDISLKEFNDDTEVGIYFGSELFELNYKENAYYGKAELPVSENFDGNVTVLITNGETRYTEIVKNYTGLMHLVDNVIFGHLEVFPHYSENKLSIPGAVTAEINSNEYFKYDKLKLTIMADDNVIYSEDFFKQQNKETEDEENSVQEESTEEEQEQDTKEEVKKDEEIEVPTTEEVEMNLGNGGSFSFYVEDIADVPANAKIRMYFDLSTIEGYTFRYEFFDAVTYSEKDKTPDQEKVETYEGFIKKDDYFPADYSIFDLKKNVYKM